MLREDIELEHFVITVIFDLKILEKEEDGQVNDKAQDQPQLFPLGRYFAHQKAAQICCSRGKQHK